MEITRDYLQGIISALYNSQTLLLGAEIEEEKSLNISVNQKDELLAISFIWIGSFKEPIFENDLPMPVYDSQVIFVNSLTKIDKIVKDVITEMEVIYNLDCPEIEQGPIKEYVGVI